MSVSLDVQLLSCKDTLSVEEAEHSCSSERMTPGRANRECRWEEVQGIVPYLPLKAPPPFLVHIR